MPFVPLTNQYFDAVAKDPTTGAYQSKDHDYNTKSGQIITSKDGKTCSVPVIPPCGYEKDKLTKRVIVCGKAFDYTGRQEINALNGIKDALYLKNLGDGTYNKPAVKAEIAAHPCLEPKAGCSEC